MSDTDKHCKNCRFFDKGNCHRYPPKVAEVGTPGRAKWVQHFPLVGENDYCGEYERGVYASRSKSAIDSIPQNTVRNLFRTAPENV